MPNTNHHITQVNALNGKTVTRAQVVKIMANIGANIKDAELKKAYKILQQLQAQLPAEGAVEVLFDKVEPPKTKAPKPSTRKNQPTGLLYGLEQLQTDPEPSALQGTQNVYEFITNMIIDRIKKGGLVWRKPWNLDNHNAWPALNFVSKKPYRGINAFLLNFTDNENPFFLTMKQVNNIKGAKVVKGSKGWPVVYFTMAYTDKKGNKITEDQYRVDDSAKSYPILKFYNVFNGEDITGIKWPVTEPVKKVEFNDISSAKGIINRMTNPPSLIHRGSMAFYQRSTDNVTMPPTKFFDSEAKYYGTLFHEFIHSTGHEKRANRMREMGRTFGDKKYAFEELIAEIGSSFLCGQAGILYHTLDNSAAYIKGWEKALIGHLKSDSKFIFKASAQAQKASDHILGDKPVQKKSGQKVSKPKFVEKFRQAAKRRTVKPNTKIPTTKTKQLELSLNGLEKFGFIRSNETPKETEEVFQLKGEMGKFLGNLQRVGLAIVLTGDYHAGKSEFVWQMANAFAENNFMVAFFDLEQGGLSSKDTIAARERNVTPNNQPKIAVVGEAANGFETVKEVAATKAADVIIVDSYQQFGFQTSAEFNELRNEFPNTIFIVIFQQNEKGGVHGGKRASYDAPIVLRAIRANAFDFKDNYIQIEKNRNNPLDLRYMIAAKKVVKIEPETDNNTQNKKQ